MRTRHNGYGLRGSYAEYGLTADRAKTLLKECREGMHMGLVLEAARKAEPDISKWILSSLLDGKSLHDMEIKWELGEAEIMPCGRNSFYAYRKLTLSILDRMLQGKETAQNGQL